MVADRSNKRLQNFSLDGTHLGFVDGFPAPCHFNERKGVMVVPDLFARVTLIDRENKVIEQLGDAGIDSWKQIRGGPREGFPVGKFVCPHSASSITRATLRGGVGRGGAGDEAEEGMNL